MREEEKTELFATYERCREFLDSKHLYRDCDRAFRFYEGEQWDEKAPKDMPLPVLNILEPIVNYKVATVSQNGMTPVLSNADYSDKDFAAVAELVCEKLNVCFKKLWEQTDMDVALWDVNTEAAISGGAALYFYWDGKGITREIKGSTDLLFGDEQQADIQKQPYIILPFRRPVEEVRAEAQKVGCKDYADIVSDNETEKQSGDYAKTEVADDKCLVLLKLWKKNGEVWMTKATRTVEIVKPTRTGLRLYPISYLVWNRIKGGSRGRGCVTPLIPNQVEINKNYARRAVAIMQTAYPKIVYRSDLIEPEEVTEIGAAIGVENSGVQNVQEAISYLSPTSSSGDATAFCSELIKLSKELTGASEAALGNINPELASGRAILAVKDSAASVLSRQLAATRKFVEDVVRVWWDIYEVYSEGGIAVSYPMQDGYVYERIPPKLSEKLRFNLKVDVSPQNAFSLYAEEQTLENLYKNGSITFEEYVEMLPSSSASPKQKLKDALSKRANTGGANAAMQQTENIKE